MAKNTRLIIDASVAVKWIVPEEGTIEALRLLEHLPLSAPDLLVAECANILWKKATRGEISPDEAGIAARLLQSSAVETIPSRPLLTKATLMAIELEHPAYDCLYLALAAERQWPFVTADQRLLDKLAQRKRSDSVPLSLKLTQAYSKTGSGSSKAAVFGYTSTTSPLPSR